MGTYISLPPAKERNLLFTSTVTNSSIESLTKSILEIESEDQYLKQLYRANNVEYSPSPIKVYIDTYGGSVYQCFGLLGIMDACKTPIHTIVTGCAMSCGFLISITGHKRFGYKKSTFMYHQISSAKMGKLKDLEESMLEASRLQSMIEEHTVEKTKIKLERLKTVYEKKEDWFMDSKQALKNGVIDEIL